MPVSLPWAAAFALGAIVSPTDPLAASAIARRLGIPRRLTTVIEGESLINDGSALVVSAREEHLARAEATEAVLAHLDRMTGEEWTRDDSIERMRGVYECRRRRLAQRSSDGARDEDEDLDERSRAFQRLVREVLEAQRDRVIALRDEGYISDEVMHALERELDLEDQRLEF